MMQGADNEMGAIVPQHVEAREKPKTLETAGLHLEVATSEFNVALQRFHIWRALAYDRELIERLGKGYAATGLMQVRTAVFESFLITLTRMFDQGARGRTPLSLGNVNLCRPEIREYISNERASSFLSFPARLALVEPLGDEDRAIFEAQAEQEAARSREHTERDFRVLTRLQRSLNKPRIRDALARLNRIRDTEIAHRDLDPSATTLSRPFYHDLDILFGAAAVLIRRMNRLGRNVDINYEDFSYRAQLRARAFVVGLRAETIDERRAISEEVRGKKTE
jgi:hypothetical protein